MEAASGWESASAAIAGGSVAPRGEARRRGARQRRKAASAWPRSSARARRPRRSECCRTAESRRSFPYRRTARSWRRRWPKCWQTNWACRSSRFKSSTATAICLPEGAGTWGDRSTKLGGGAIILAGRDMKQKILGLAAHILEAPEENLDIEDGHVVSRTGPGERLPVAEIASAAHRDPERFPDGLEGGLISTRRYQDPGWVGGSTGTHVAVVEVDVDTGGVAVLRYVAVEDCGRVINPMVVEGQVHGCIAQALGEVLLEELVYDDAAQLVTGTLMDYAIPRADQLPDIEVRLIGEPSDETLARVQVGGRGGVLRGSARDCQRDLRRTFAVRGVDQPAAGDAGEGGEGGGG